MANEVDLGAEARSLAERLRATCLGQWQLDKERAEGALADHLAALGVPARPARWMGAAEKDESSGARDGFLAAWAVGQFFTTSGIQRFSDANKARNEAENAASAELKSLDQAVRKQAEAAGAAARGETQICGKWNVDQAGKYAASAHAEAKSILSGGQRAGAWVEDKISRYSLLGMMTPFMGFETKRSTSPAKSASPSLRRERLGP